MNQVKRPTRMDLLQTKLEILEAFANPNMKNDILAQEWCGTCLLWIDADLAQSEN